MQLSNSQIWLRRLVHHSSAPSYVIQPFWSHWSSCRIW